MFEHPKFCCQRSVVLLQNFSVKENIFSDDVSCVNLIVAWNGLARSTKLLISFSGKVHTKKNVIFKFLLDDRFFWAIAASSYFSM